MGLTGLFRRWMPHGGIRRSGDLTRSTIDPVRRGGIADGSPESIKGASSAGTSSLERLPSIPSVFGDPRFASLRRAAMNWQRSSGPRRLVIDQVCLVPDVPTFFEAIASWDEYHFFPILIDEPAWTLPFLRAFRPSRVVRYTSVRAVQGDGNASDRKPDSAAGRLAHWQKAMEAVAKAWSEHSPPGGKFFPAGSPPRRLGATPPGIVLSAPDSTMLAGAVTLAAGRFQPLVRIEPTMWKPNEPRDTGRRFHSDDILTLNQAIWFARRIEARVASVTPRYSDLGDDCDFLTIAGDWPYRYDNDLERPPVRGIHSLDDLIGRTLEGAPDAQGLSGFRHRWAFCGRLQGDPAASVARAMGSLFLEPSATLLWDTYDLGGARADYGLLTAAENLNRASTTPGRILLRSAGQADLGSWHGAVDPRNRFGFVWINSSGSPQMFTIPGGPGRPADLPTGLPTAVVMIHSFSAASPSDPETIAGRWLEQGAFVFFGSVNEPYLHAFRPARLATEMAIAQMPLGAALRQGEYEPFGRPWRLIYLGDPLYAPPISGIRATLPLPDADFQESPEGRLGGTGQSPLPSKDVPGMRSLTSDRVDSVEWHLSRSPDEPWPVTEINPRVSYPVSTGSAEMLLRWCQDAAVSELVKYDIDGLQFPKDGVSPDLCSVLKQIPRAQLGRASRKVYDDLLIEVLRDSGDLEELYARLASLPPNDCSPRVWHSLENLAMVRLARLAQVRDLNTSFTRALDLWDATVRISWPPNSAFPTQFTQRVAAMAEADAPRRLEAWLDRLRLASKELLARSPHASVITSEQARILAKVGVQRRGNSTD